jgi:hypothetical protein
MLVAAVSSSKVADDAVTELQAEKAEHQLLHECAKS